MANSLPYEVSPVIDLTTVSEKTQLFPRGLAIRQISVRKCTANAPLELAFGNGDFAPWQETDLIDFDRAPLRDGVYIRAIGAAGGDVAVIMAVLDEDGA